MNMELENRHIVIKNSDAISYLSETDRNDLERMLGQVAAGREASGKRPLRGLHIESDWPEFEPAKAAILARISRS